MVGVHAGQSVAGWSIVLAMTKAPDMDQLARRYLDLWQGQVAALSNDPAFADAMVKAYSLMTQGTEAVAKAAGMAMAQKKTEAQDFNADSKAPPRPPSPAAPTVEPSLDVVHLARRVAELEDRVVHLEAALAAAGGNAAKRHRGRKPAGV